MGLKRTTTPGHHHNTTKKPNRQELPAPPTSREIRRDCATAGRQDPRAGASASRGSLAVLLAFELPGGCRPWRRHSRHPRVAFPNVRQPAAGGCGGGRAWQPYSGSRRRDRKRFFSSSSGGRQQWRPLAVCRLRRISTTPTSPAARCPQRSAPGARPRQGPSQIATPRRLEAASRCPQKCSTPAAR